MCKPQDSVMCVRSWLNTRHRNYLTVIWSIRSIHHSPSGFWTHERAFPSPSLSSCSRWSCCWAACFIWWCNQTGVNQGWLLVFSLSLARPLWGAYFSILQIILHRTFGITISHKAGMGGCQPLVLGGPYFGSNVWAMPSRFWLANPRALCWLNQWFNIPCWSECKLQ